MSTALKNPANIETVDASRHSKLKVKANPGFGHAKDLHVAGIVLTELAQCAANFPIVLIKRPDDGSYLLAAMLGLRGGENVYFGPQYWESAYIPLSVQRHPFVIGYDDRVPNGAEVTTCILTDSDYVNEKDGTALFNADGQESDFLKQWHQILNNMFVSQKATDRFIDTMVQMDLISPLHLQLQRQDGEVRGVTGLFTLDEAKTRQLTTEQIRDLHQADFLAPCYLIMASLHQLTQLVRMRNRRGSSEQIVDFRIEFTAEPIMAAQ